MARKGKAVNRRKPGKGGRPPLIALVLVVALIGLGFFLLERTRSVAPPPAKPTQTAPAPHLRLPQRPPLQQKLSSAGLPAAKPPVALAPHPGRSLKTAGPGSLAIIIDDMGGNLQEVQALLSIKLPLTFSVIPSLARAKGVAEAAHQAGAQVMIHMPMEPEGYPKQRMEKIGLLLSMDDAEIEKRVEGYFPFVPFAEGANNHMGSRFTQSAEKMEVVLKVLKGKGLFFVDSRTSPASAAYRTARSLGLKCGTRQVFLDNVQDEAAIGKQLSQAAAIARKSGAAIAICHPHPSTIRALQALMPRLAREGITFVLASALTS